MTRRTHGQALVLGCMYLLLVTLMVMMSLSFGARIKEKVEQNTVAETAAYSEAVAVARAYNAASFMNRAMIAHWLNIAGAESLISWTVSIFAEMSSLMEAFIPQSSWVPMGQNGVNVLPGYTNGGGASNCMNHMVGFLAYVHFGAWERLNIDLQTFIDDANRAGDQGRRLQGAIANLRDMQGDTINAAYGAVQSGAIISQVVSNASAGGIGDLNARAVPASANYFSARKGIGSDETWWAVMDTRAPFVKSRNFPVQRVVDAIRAEWIRALSGNPYTIGIRAGSVGGRTVTITATGAADVQMSSEGHACFGEDWGNCEGGPDWTNVLAEDNASATFNASNIVLTLEDGTECPPMTLTSTGGHDSKLRSSDIHHDDDKLDFDTGDGSSPRLYQLPPADAFTHLTMGECTDNFALRPCHSVGVTPWGIDRGGPINGQAKAYSMVWRDGSRRIDPFEMRLGVRFRRGGGGGETLDMKGNSNPSSAAAAVAYYHRRDHFEEGAMPNLFNPYWRATMVGVERKGSDALPFTNPTAAMAWAALKGAGYAGER